MSPGFRNPRKAPSARRTRASSTRQQGADSPRRERTNIRPHFLLGCSLAGLVLGFGFQILHEPEPESPLPVVERAPEPEAEPAFELNTSEVRPEIPDLALPDPPPDPEMAGSASPVERETPLARIPRPPMPPYALDPRWGLTGRTAVPPPKPAATPSDQERSREDRPARDWEPTANPELDI